MLEKGYPTTEEQQSQQTEVMERTPDMSQVLASLNLVFTTFRDQLQEQTPKPFEGAAKIAVDVFNDILAALQYKSIPNRPALSVKANSATEIQLTWTTDNTLNEAGFKIFRCEGQGCQNVTQLGEPLPASARSYLDNSASANTTYRYRVAAFNSKGESLSDFADATTPAVPRK